METLTHPTILALVAALPAAATWWASRALLRSLDRPAVDERLTLFRQRRSGLAACGVMALVALRPAALLWTLPLMFTLLLAASYPLRRTLLAETWTFAQYAGFFVRLTTGALGFWVLLAATPAITSVADGWAVAAALGTVMVLWDARYSVVLRRTLRARAIDEEPLRTRLVAVLERSAAKAVAFERVPVTGGVVANALALPSTGGAAVLFSDTLLERFTPEEIEAIAAHELAHVEHYDRRRLLRLRAVTWTLVALSAFGVPLARTFLPDLAELLPYAWVIALPIGLALRGSARQHLETASDLRALELTANPEALVSALVKLHAIGRVPRRADAERERHATHPSLARRIQAIRDRSGVTAAPLTEPASFSSEGGEEMVTFEPERLIWREGEAASFSASYSRLSELRVQPDSSGALHLVVVDAARRPWKMVLRPADVASVQATLDLVDVRLGAATAPNRRGLTVLARIAVTVLALAAAAIAQWAAALVALAAAVRPAPALLAAGGASVAMAAALTWASWPTDDSIHALLVVMCLDAIAVVLIAWRQRADMRHPVRLWVVALSLLTGLAWAAVMVGMPSADAIGWHRAAARWPAAAVWPFALAGALLLAPRPRVRLAAAPLVIAALATAHAGSIEFLDRFGQDPLLAPAPPATLRTITSAPEIDIAAPAQAGALALSTDGRYVALVSDADSGRTMFVGSPGGPLEAIDADQVAFLGGERLLALKHDGQRARISDRPRRSDLSLQGGATIEHRFERIHFMRLIAQEDSGGWSALGWSEEGDIVAVSGQSGIAETSERRWPATDRGDADSSLVSPIGVSADGPILLRTRYDHRALARSGAWWRLAPRLAAASMVRGADVWMHAASGHGQAALRSQFELTCESNLSDGRPFCLAFDDHRTRFVALHTKSEGVTASPLMELPGRFNPSMSSSESVAGWWNGRAVAVRWLSREVFEIDTGEGVPVQLALAGDRVAALMYGAAGARLQLYRLPPSR